MKSSHYYECLSQGMRGQPENPRGSYVGTQTIGVIHDPRARQLHDEEKSGGNQPAHIRVIYSR